MKRSKLLHAASLMMRAAKITPPILRSARWAATVILALLTTVTAWATTTSTINVGGTDYTLFTGFTATGGTNASAAAYNYPNLVDGNLDGSSSWHLNNDTQPYYIEFNADNPIIPKGYIFNTYSADNFKPTSWVLRAKANIGDDWTELDNLSGQSISVQEYSHSCNNEGNNAYKYFRFEVSNTSNNIWLTEIRLYGSSPDVYYTRLTKKDATCTETGIKQDCYLRNDGKYFTDNTGTTELAESDVIDPIKPHTGVHHEATDVNIEYWQCSMCGKYFSNEGCTTEITEEDTKIYRTITIDNSISGLVTSNVNQALAGAIVKLTVSHLIDASTLKVNNGEVELTDIGSNQYTFTVPADNVTVTAETLSTYSFSLPDNMEIVSATNEADGNGKYISGTVITFAPSLRYSASNVSDGTNTLEPDANGVYTVTIENANINITATVVGSSTLYLAGATSDFTAADGETLVGSTSHTVTIANGANITLNNATITGGIVCEGTATITLDGTNSVTGASQKAGIQVGGSSTTLTIKGNGSLTATGGSAAAGIGLGRTWDASVTAGAIVIEGGTVNASGDIGIGIGTVGNSQTATIGGISIKGGTVSASLGKGNIYYGSTATVGYIKIYDTIDMVDASKITETVTYMHVDGESATDVTANKTDYFTIGENGDRRIIVPKDDTDYTITIAEGIEHGTITGATTAKYMETVTINATPDFGYRLVRLVVKDADDNDVASTGNTFLMPKSNVTVSAVFEQGTHGTTEFTWFYSTGPEPTDEVRETIYDGATTVNIQQTGQSYNILKYDEYTYSNFRLDNDTYEADIPYAGGTGEFYETGNATNFSLNYDGETGYYDITMTDAGNGKWSVSILPTAAQMDVVPDQTYTGSAITPEPLVIAGSLSLTKGTDYTYSYTNNTNVGTATVRATFQGTYASLGYVEKTFTIMPDWTYNTEGGYYEISDADDLNALATYVNAGIDASGKTFKQTADIDMQGVSYTPIGNDEGTHMFNGTYDGDGYFILNISHSISGINELSGLFGDLRGTVKNVNLKDCNFTAYRVGAIAGQTSGDCLIQNCNVIGGTITGTDNSPQYTHGSYMGGIVGYFYDKTATNCFSTASFGGDAYHKGPVVGWNGGTVTDCYYVNTPGGNSEGTQVTVYDITLGDGITMSGNFRTVGRTAANTYRFGKENDVVTLTITPAAGFNIGTVKYNDGTEDHIITPTNDEYSFTMPASDVTVSATWTAIEYTITYNGVEGATFSTDKNSFTIESDDITLDEPTRTGYDFGGWYDNSGLTGDAVTTIAAGSTDDVTLWAKWTASENINLTANLAPDENYWTTFYCGDAGYVINDGENACAYTATYSDGKLTLHNQGKMIAKGEAVIIVADNNEVSMTKGEDGTKSADNDLHGVDVETSTADIQTTLGSGMFYVLGMMTVNEEQHFGFHKYTGETMAARKAFVMVNGTGDALARSLTMVFDEATGIESLTPCSPGLSQGEGSEYFYTLDGRRLNGKPTKAGLYINNGRKIVIK